MAWRTTTWWKRCYEGLRGARVVSPFFCEFSLAGFVLGLCCGCLCCLPFLDLAGENSCIQLRFHFFCEFLVVDRPCPVLARQCRKKKFLTEGLRLEHTQAAISKKKHPGRSVCLFGTGEKPYLCISTPSCALTQVFLRGFDWIFQWAVSPPPWPFWLKRNTLAQTLTSEFCPVDWALLPLSTRS